MHIHFNVTNMPMCTKIHINNNMPMRTVSCLTNTKLSILDTLLLGPKDPIPLWHFGLKEVKARIDLMDDQFDRPMVFDPAQIPDPAVAGQSVGAWGQGVAVCGAAKGYQRPRTTPTLMASMFGFECEEEMDDAKKYLLLHGSYQLEQVSCQCSLFSIYFTI